MNNNLSKIFTNACYHNDLLLAKKLLHHQHAKTLHSVLCSSSYRGNAEIVRMILDCELSDPNNNGACPLRWAVKKGHGEITKMIIEDGRSNPAGDNSQVLRWAIKDDNIDIIKMLLDDGRVDKYVLEDTDYEYLLEEYA